jgi:hypothetical protein
MTNNNWSLILKNGINLMLGVNMKNTNIPLPMNNVLVFFDTLTLPYSNHKPKKIASPYVQNNMGFIMIIQLNA